MNLSYSAPTSLTVAIPTLDRGRVLIETIEQLLPQLAASSTILVADQTRQYEHETLRALEELESHLAIRRLRLPLASQPMAMNLLLAEAKTDLVLFLDDDVQPSAGLLEAHARAYEESPEAWAVVGQVLQPGQVAEDVALPAPRTGLTRGMITPFHSTCRGWVENVMSGNLSVRRSRALGLGGFDESFVGAAYRFDTDFAYRVLQAGGKILFEPKASLRHLGHPRGGTHVYGDHFRTTAPYHSAGDYYFALKHGFPAEASWYMGQRFVRSFLTRYHLRHPWWIPAKVVGEFRGFVLAAKLHRARLREGAQ